MEIEDYNKYYIQGSDHYLIPKDVFIELFNEMINWKEESKKQKKAFDKIIEIINYYGVDEEYNDNAILRHILKDMLDILKEVSE